ncbi:MAG: hypothetical protein A2029_05800, partial [Chloroflexi bacterium RBG_19FT_COMBO_47_9]
YTKFAYRNVGEVMDTARELGISFPYSAETMVLAQPIEINRINLPNRILIQPLECCDALPDGSPSKYTLRRYGRIAESGAAVLWTEANAIDKRYASSNGQLHLTKENLDSFKRMLEDIRSYYLRVHGFNPIIIVQATHSGRYSKIDNKTAPIIAQHNKYIEGANLLPDECIVSDVDLHIAEEKFGVFAKLAKEAGFNSIDIKCSHFYLASELLSAYYRPGEYGGTFENRTRFIMNCMRAAKPETNHSFFLTCRLNCYDGFPYPWGFGVREGSSIAPDYSEANRLVAMLHEEIGIELFNITLGNPYVNPYMNRPYDSGSMEPPEHPLVGVARMIESARCIKKANPSVLIVGSGLSYLRQFTGVISAGALKDGCFDMAGFGRLALANPRFTGKLISNELTKKDCCITCSSCTQLMRSFNIAGCVVRDSQIYGKRYKEMMRS